MEDQDHPGNRTVGDDRDLPSSVRGSTQTFRQEIHHARRHGGLRIGRASLISRKHQNTPGKWTTGSVTASRPAVSRALHRGFWTGPKIGLQAEGLFLPAQGMEGHMNLDLMSDLYMAAVGAVVVVGWFAREIAA